MVLGPRIVSPNASIFKWIMHILSLKHVQMYHGIMCGFYCLCPLSPSLSHSLSLSLPLSPPLPPPLPPSGGGVQSGDAAVPAGPVQRGCDAAERAGGGRSLHHSSSALQGVPVYMFIHVHGRVLCLEYRVSWVRVPPEAAHFF